MLEHVGAGDLCVGAEPLGVFGTCYGIGDFDVLATKVYSPGADRALEKPVFANGHGLDVLCWLGGVGRFPSAELGALGPCGDVGLPSARRNCATDRARAKTQLRHRVRLGHVALKAASNLNLRQLIVASDIIRKCA